MKNCYQSNEKIIRVLQLKENAVLEGRTLKKGFLALLFFCPKWLRAKKASARPN